MKAASSLVVAGASLALPELAALRELRRALAHGGLPRMDVRTPADHARIASFRTVEELLWLLDRFRGRIASGERCRLVEREHRRDPDRLVVEISIEVQP
jgi:hypothetical protein